MFQAQEGISGYQALSAHLHQMIAAGVFPAGSQLPTELEISRQYHLNRHTVRRALEVLTQAGLVYRLRGKGTFVAAQKIPYRVSTKTQFTTSILEAGCRPHAKLVTSYELRADGMLADRLEIEAGAKVTVLEIVRFADDLPFCLTRTHLAAERFPGLVQYLTGSFSLYQVLREQYGLEARRVASTFEVALPEKADLEMLQVAPTVPLLLVASLARDQHGRVVEWCHSKFRGDYCSITINFAEEEKE